MGGEEVNSHCGGERVIFFMDFVMYFLLAVVKELGWRVCRCTYSVLVSKGSEHVMCS